MSQDEERSRTGALSGMDAAFEGFRITREHPFAVLIWAILFFGLSILSQLVMETMAGDGIAGLRELQGSAQPNPAEIWAIIGSIIPASLVVLLIALSVWALVTNAVMRAAASERRAAVGHIRMGGREFWQSLNLLLWSLIIFVVYLAAAIVSIIPTFLVSFLIGMATGPVAIAVAPIVAIIVVALIVLLVSARLSLAGPITTVEGGIGLGRSWSATKGMTWAFAGALFIAWVFALIVTVLVGVVALSVMSVIAGGLEEAWAYIMNGAMDGGPFSPLGLTYLAFSSVLNTLSTVIVLGVGIGAYRQLRRKTSI